VLPHHDCGDRSQDKERSRDSHFIFYTQNANGLKRVGKIDAIVDRMRRSNIDIYLVQETWLEGEGREYEHVEINGYTAFFHGNATATCSRGRGGVAIFLSKRAKKAWEDAGANKPLLSGPIDGCARWMAIKLKTREPKPRDLFVVTAYHPTTSGANEGASQDFYQKFDTFLEDSTHHQPTIIIGCDANSPLGVSQGEDDRAILGKYGGHHTRDDEAEHLLRNLLHKHKLRASTTDFLHNRYDTWYTEGLGATAQLDYFFVSQDKKERNVTDAKRISNGIESDHAAIKLKFKLHRISKPADPRKRPEPPINWRELNRQTNKQRQYARLVDETVKRECERDQEDGERPSVTNWNRSMITAARTALPQPRKKKQDWFQMSSDPINAAISQRNAAYDAASKDPTNEEKTRNLKATMELEKTGNFQSEDLLWNILY
jgi:exonuclease III